MCVMMSLLGKFIHVPTSGSHKPEDFMEGAMLLKVVMGSSAGGFSLGPLSSP